MLGVPPCPFCALDGERLVAEDDLVVAIRDGRPVSPGHTLIITRRHVRSLTEATAAEAAAILRVLGTTRAALDAELHPDGYNIGINDGVAAGQTIMHLHVHLIPRFTGDVANPRGGVRHCIPGQGCHSPSRPG